MVQIDLVYPREDAVSARLRSELRDALHLLDLPPKWDEYEGEDARPAYARNTPGPAVYIEGLGVAGADGSAGSRSKILLAVQDVLSRR